MEKVSTGKTAGFEVNTSFPVNVTFQWQHNNMNITEATRRILTVMDITKDVAGNYSCIVTTVFGLKVSSQHAQLKVCKYENYFCVIHHELL